MKAVILYQPSTETERSVQEYVREFARQTGKSIGLVDSDSVEGEQMKTHYDVLQFPAIIVCRDDGSYVESWDERDKWPTVSELSYYS